MSARFAILMDGGFVRLKLHRRLGRFPGVEDVVAEIDRLKECPELQHLQLLRTYFYDSPPASGMLVNPVSGQTLDLGMSPIFAANAALQQGLELVPDLALRKGETDVHGWTVGEAALRDMARTGRREIAENDLVPKIEQKGVDLRIGLDIARLSIQRMVEAIVVVTGDSDMVPAFKFARREGVRVILSHMGHTIKRELKVHADLVLPA